MGRGRRCDWCEYYNALNFEGIAKDRNGECRINPPQPILRRDVHNSLNELRPVWPLVDADDWCGKFVPRETEDGKAVRGWND